MQSTNKSNNNTGRERPDLDRRYGKIGISAVAAAIRYQSDGKNPRYAPVIVRSREEREGVAA